MTLHRSAYIGIFALLAIAPAGAHSPICNCYDNGDGSITCEGGFSDGASAAGVAIRILDDNERILIDAQMDSLGSFTFPVPNEEFHVVFDAGQNHNVTVYKEDIE